MILKKLLFGFSVYHTFASTYIKSVIKKHYSPVVIAHTIVNVRTVVIKLSDTSVTHSTVLGT